MACRPRLRLLPNELRFDLTPSTGCVKAHHGVLLVHITTMLEVVIAEHIGHLSLQDSILSKLSVGRQISR